MSTLVRKSLAGAAPTAHAASHQPGGSDAIAVDAAAATGSLRTLGPGATQAALGSDSVLGRRRRVQMSVQGYFAETFDRNGMSNSSACATGVLYAISIGLLAGEVVTKIGLEVGTAGSAVTLAKAALLDKDGNRLAVTADEKANLTIGAKLLSVLTPYTVLADDLFYLAYMNTFTTTGIAIKRSLGGVASADSRLTGATYGSIATLTAQTDIQSTNALVFNGAQVPLPLWMCVA